MPWMRCRLPFIFWKRHNKHRKEQDAPDPEKPLDRTLDVLEAKNSAASYRCVIFLATCHAVFNSDGRKAYTISANFPGTTREHRFVVKQARMLFLSRDVRGDINPRNSSDHRETGKGLADDILK